METAGLIAAVLTYLVCAWYVFDLSNAEADLNENKTWLKWAFIPALFVMLFIAYAVQIVFAKKGD